LTPRPGRPCGGRRRAFPPGRRGGWAAGATAPDLGCEACNEVGDRARRRV